eukprot:scaffold13.g228.t1
MHETCWGTCIAEQGMEGLLPLLDVVFHPAAAPEDKQRAEAELRRLGRSPDALPWAAGVLQGGQAAAADPRLLFFAAGVLEDAAVRGLVHLPPDQRAALQQCLWAGVMEPGLPAFVAAKLAAALAHVAATADPPGFWEALQSTLADLVTLDRGLTLLAATVETLQALSAATASVAGAKGKVGGALQRGRRVAEHCLWCMSGCCGRSWRASIARLCWPPPQVLSSQVPEVRARLRQLQRFAASTLCSLLQHLAPGLPAAAQHGDQRTLGAALKALSALRTTVGSLPSLAALTRGPAGAAALAATVAEYALAVRLAAPGAPGEEAALQISAAAMDCLCDLLTKDQDAPGMRDTLCLLLPKLQARCSLARRSLARGDRATWQLSSQRAAALRHVRDNAAAPAPLHAVPQEACDAMLQRWAACGNRMQLEDPALAAFIRLAAQLFSSHLAEAEPSPALLAAALGLLGRPVLDMARLLLTTLFGDAVPAPGDGFEQQEAPFSLAVLDATLGSGAPMDDWLQAVLAGGDAGEGAEERAEEAAAGVGEGDEEEEGSDAVLVSASSQQGFALTESEADVYVRHAEAFLARAVGTFSADLLPAVLQQLEAARPAFVAACEQLVASGSAAAAAAPTAAAVRAGLTRMEVALRLVARCGPYLPATAAGERLRGVHAVRAYSAVAQLAGMWLGTLQRLAAATSAADPVTPAGRGGPASSLPAFVQVGMRIHKCLAALTATWLPQVMMAAQGGDSSTADADVAAGAASLVEALLSAAAQLLGTLPHLPAPGVLHAVALAAAEGLISLSSISLASGTKPPAALLRAVVTSQHYQTLQQVAHQSLAASMLLPPKARRALFVALSDFCLRSWAAQPGGNFEAPVRAAQFGTLVAPLLHCLAAAAAEGAAEGALEAACRAAAASASVVQSFFGSPKAVRGIVASGLALPALQCTVPIVQRALGGAGAPRHRHHAKLAAAMLRLLTAVVEALGTELSTQLLGELLGSLCAASPWPSTSHFSPTTGGDPTLETDLLLIRLLCSALSGAASRHHELLLPALRLCAATFERASGPQARAAADADPHHVRAAALAAMLSLLRYRWRALAGGGARPAAAAHDGGGGGAGGAGAHPLAASVREAAAASGSAQSAEGGSAEGAAAIAHVLQLLVEYFESAATLQVVLRAEDVRLVLEELYDLQVATRLYASRAFEPARGRLLAALLALLCSRCYGGAAEALADSLYGLAAANHTAWLTAALPAFLERHMGALGAGERAGLAGLFGAGDLEAGAFERAALAFVNDAAFYERCR